MTSRHLKALKLRTLMAVLAFSCVDSDAKALASPLPHNSPFELYMWIAIAVALIELGILLWFRQKYEQLKAEVEVSSRKTKHAMLQFESQAFYDPLTQLPNRRLFRDGLLQTIKTANRNKSRFCVIMADLDKFKPINDTLGHEAGDDLLKQVVGRLKDAVRESDTIARYGGDEFAFVCPSLQDRGAIATLCMRILNAIQAPFILQGKEYCIGISLGIAVFPEHGLDEEVLIRHADTALYRAKEKRNTFVIYDPKLDSKMS